MLIQLRSMEDKNMRNWNKLFCLIIVIGLTFMSARQSVARQPQESQLSPQETTPQKSTIGGFFKNLSDSLGGKKKAEIKQADPIESSIPLNSAVQTSIQGTSSVQSQQLPKSIRMTQLAGLFAKYPWDGTPRTYFPRVAITVVDWSGKDCWIAVATVWMSKSKSESVPPFSVCWSKSLGSAINNAASLHLFIEQSALENSGNVRTMGPKPPMMAVPMQTPLSQEAKQSAYTGFIEQLVVSTGWQPGAPTNFWIANFSVDGVKANSSAAATSNAARESTEQPTIEQESSTTVASKTQGISMRCTVNNLNIEKYNQITVGMTLDAVNKILGCTPDSDLTQRSSVSIYFTWAATVGNHFGARTIGVSFDPKGERVKALGTEFKRSQGF